MSLVRFTYSPLTAGKHLVGIAGEFTDWQIIPLEEHGGSFGIDLDIPEGRYRYKYIVDGNWIADENSEQKEIDPYGGYNSVLVVRNSLHQHSWTDIFKTNEIARVHGFIKLYRSSKECAELRFIWFPALVDDVHLLLANEKKRLKRIGRTAIQEVYGDFIDTSNQLTGNVIRFIIEVIHCGEHYYFGKEGVARDLNLVSALEIDIRTIKVFSIPDWVHKSVVYQIFPDRFYNGNPDINPDFSEWYYQDCKTPPSQGEYLQVNREYYHFVNDWSEINGLIQSEYLPEGKPDWWSFYGGDIAGVRDKLDYLTALGISVIYFNPLWQAKSNHKYDSADYMSIDPHFGTLEELKALVEEAHNAGIRIILDVAFNHTGETFWAFRDCVARGSESPYWNWYDWFNWPLPSPLPENFKPKDYYQCWWGIKDMPDLNYDLSRPHPEENAIHDIKAAQPNESLVAYVLKATRWWLLNVGIDGFRLDVPDEVPFWFWELFRKEVKRCKPDAWIVGEIWHDAVKWVSARYFDSVMNYAFFKYPVTDFFINKQINKHDFCLKIESGLALYPTHAAKAMMNLLGSHDTFRIFEIGGECIESVKHAILFQMCFVGTPHIYYGDEIAMRGANDPDNRRPFDWNWQERELSKGIHDFYTELIALRASYPVLTDGDFCFVDASPNLLCYKRTLNNIVATVCQNVSDQDVSIDIELLENMVFSTCKVTSNILPAGQSLIAFQHS